MMDTPRMDTAIRSRLPGTAWLGLLAATVLGGCQLAPVPAREPVTTEKVIALSAAGTPPEAIIKEIAESDTVYLLDAQDVIDLHEKGVDTRVIDYMMKTERRAFERRAYYDAYSWPPYPYYPYYPYYPSYRYGFGWYW